MNSLATSAKSLSILSLAILVSACAKSGGDSSGPGGTADTSGNYKSGNCGPQVVSDYNTVVLRCSYMSTASDARNCKSSAQSFLNKYPGINCTAVETSRSSVQDQQVVVTDAKLRKVIDDLTAAGY